MIQLYSPYRILSKELGEKAYTAGIARKNGSLIFDSEKVSHALGSIHFFEFNMCSSCNLKCIYCSSETSTSDMKKPDVSIGKLWIDRVYEYINKEKVYRPTIEFTGGEPLVNVDFMAEVCEYMINKLKDICSDIDIVFSTNLTVLDDKQIDFIKRFKPKMQVSLDGPEDIQNLHRPFPNGKGSYQTVINNLKHLSYEGVPVNSVSSVITAKSVDRMPEIAQQIIDLGIVQMTLQPMNAVGQARNVISLMPDPQKYVDKLFETADKVILPFWLKTKADVHVRHLGLSFAYLLQPWRNYMCQRCPCGSASSIISTNSKGEVYGCNQAPFDDSTVLGNIKTMSFWECQKSDNAQRFRNRDLKEIEMCSQCLYRSFCQGGCPRTALTLHGGINYPGDACEMNKALISKALEKMVCNEYPIEFIRTLANSYMAVNSHVR